MKQLDRRRFDNRPFREAFYVLGVYIRAQVVIALAVTVLYGIGFAVARLPLWPLIAMAGGAASLIPRFGSLIPLALVGIAILFTDFDLAQMAIAFGSWLAVQAIEGFVLQPVLLSKPLGLKALWVFVAMLAGSLFFGPLGFLLAVPVLAVANVFWKHWNRRLAARAARDE